MKKKKKRGVCKNVDTFTIQMDGYIRASMVDRAVEVLVEMKKSFMDPSTEIYVALIQACTTTRQFKTASQVMAMMRQSKTHHVDLESVLGPCKGSIETLIWSLFQASYNTKPGHVSSSLSESLGENTETKWRLVIDLFQDLVFAKQIPSEPSFWAAMEGYLQVKDLLGLVKTWSSFQTSGHPVTPRVFSTLARGVLEIGQTNSARAFLKSMKDKSYPLNEDSYSSVLVMMARIGDTKGIMGCIVDLTNQGHTLRPSVYTQMIKQWKSGNYQDKLDLIEFVETHSPESIALETTD